MAKTPKVFVAPVEMVGPLCTLLRQLHASSAEAIGEIDEVKATDFIRDMILQPPGRIWIAMQEDVIVGSVGVYGHRDWWTSEWYLLEAWVYVKPGARSYALVRSLLDVVKHYARVLEKDLIIGTYGGGEVERKRKLYERQGFRRFGEFYRMET